MNHINYAKNIGGEGGGQGEVNLRSKALKYYTYRHLQDVCSLKLLVNTNV